MKKGKYIFVYVVLIFLFSANAGEKTIVLQNGAEYDGARDTYIAHQVFDGIDPEDDALNHCGEQYVFVQNCLT